MDNKTKNICDKCGKPHEKRNIDLLPTWLQCRSCGRLYCVKCANSSILRISIEKLMMIIIVVLFLYIGVFILEDSTTPFTGIVSFGIILVLLPVASQMLLLKYHERNVFKDNNVLRKCLGCSASLNSLYHDSILNNWLFTIYAFNLLVFLFEFFFKLYNLYSTSVYEVVFLSNFGVILWIILLIGIILSSVIIVLKLYKHILSSFQSSYRIWIVVILIFSFSIIISMICIQFTYILSYSGFLNHEIMDILNIIFTISFAAIPKLFWLIPPFLISAIIYSFSQKFLMSHKSNNWLKLGIGFIIIILPISIWGIFYPFFYNAWENIIIWGIANFIFNLIFTLSLFTILEKASSGKKTINLKSISITILSIIILIFYILRPWIIGFLAEPYISIYTFVITTIVICLTLYEIFISWFDENNTWRSKVGKKITDAAYLVIVGFLCYCIAMNMLYLLSISPLHISNYIDVWITVIVSVNYTEILFPNIMLISYIGIFGIFIASILKILIKKFIK